MAEQTDVMTSFQLPEDFQLLPPPEPRPDTDVTVTDALKAFGVGAADLAAGVGEVAEQTLSLGGSLRELAHSGSQALRRSMTDDGQTALRTPLFTETDGGNLTWGEGAGDLDVWAMKIANGLGSMAGMLIPGGAVGQAARITLGQAITRSMLKRGASLNVAQQVAEKVVRHMASATAIGTGLTGSLGATAIDVATQVKDMDTAWLAAHSPYFRHQVNALARQAQVKNATQILKQAKEATAQRVSAAVLSDPVAIAGSAVGALGDRVLFGALTNRLRGGILKSGVRSGLAEGSAESAENLGHTYAANTQLNTIVGTDRAPLEGAKAAMAEGFSVGAITGSVPGMIGGWRGKGVVAQPEAKPSSNAPEPELETDSLPPRPTPTQHESPSPPHNPQPQAAALPVTPRSPSPIPPTEPNDVEPSPHSSSSVRAPDAAALSPQEKIVDFGDVLHGARKHLWGQYGQAMEHHPSDEEWRRKPLSQLFPKPNLSALIKQKVPPERALLLSVLRERLPPKPKLASKVASWRVSVEKTLALSRQLVQPLADESLPDAVSRAIAHTDLPILMKAAQGLTPEQLTRLAKLKVNRGQYTQLNGARFTPARTFYHATEGNKRQALTERVSTEAEMVTALQQWVRDPNDAAESGRRKVNLKVYRTRDPHPERFIGVDVGKRHVRLIGGFASAQAAREHLNTHRDTLEQEVLALRKKLTQEQRTPHNRRRAGKPRREGKVTPESFTRTFGFRGVQFGNWVEDKRRQAELNDAHDALVDLADALDLPPKAVSLNGTLGLAFGARGKGKAKAHYEPGTLVINLTKPKGAGSLAHEWFHAIDHHLGRREGSALSEFLTDIAHTPLEKKALRQALTQSVKQLREAVMRTDLPKRSARLDRFKSRPYWASMTEMTARAFEAYIIARNRNVGITNDYLANVLNEADWQRQFGHDSDMDYAYPTQSELNTEIAPAFDRLFEVLDTQVNGEHVQLFSRTKSAQTSAESRKASLAPDQVARISRHWLKHYQGEIRVRIKVVKTASDLPYDKGRGEVHAVYEPSTQTVTLVASSLRSPEQVRRVLRHEILVHHGLRSVLGEHEHVAILRAIQGSRHHPSLQPLWDEVRTRYGELNLAEQAEEVMALAAEQTRPAIKRWWDALLSKLWAALKRLGWFPSTVRRSELLHLIDTLEQRIANKSARPNTVSSEVMFSRTKSASFEAALNATTPQRRLKGILSHIGYAAKQTFGGSKGLGAITLRQLADLSQSQLPSVQHYVNTVHQMLTRRNQWAYEAGEMAQRIQKWASKHQQTADTLFDIAHLATVDGVDPDGAFVSAKAPLEKAIRHLEKVNEGSHKTSAQMRELKAYRRQLESEPFRQVKHQALKTRFDALPDEAKQHYRTMRDAYQARHRQYRTLIEQQIERADIDNRLKKKRLADLKLQFELQSVMAPYFPLARFGEYWLSSVDEQGEKHFLMFESEKAQQDASKRLRTAGFTVSTGRAVEGLSSMEGASLNFVLDLMHHVDDTQLNDLKKSELKDTIYQLYLQSLPTRSMRKQFLHRKKTKGWSNDALRALASNMMRGAYQLARLEYSDTLSQLAADTKKAAQVSNSNQASRYAEELLKRHEWIMNPSHSTVAQHLTSMGFIWMLGASPAAAMVNLTQNMVVALPILASRFGLRRAAGELLRTMASYPLTQGSVKRKLQGEERQAYQQWHDTGLLDVTQSHELAGIAESKNWEYNARYDRVMNWIARLFHQAEVYNRETTAIAAYRLARADGRSHADATHFAEEATWKAHFDYTNANRARYMQPPFMKVLTQFKQYSQSMTYYLMRNAYLSMRGMNKETRTEARRQLVGTLAMTSLLGGVSALPLSLVYGMANALNAAMGDDDVPWDAETEFKRYLYNALGNKTLVDGILYGVGGAGLSPRISLDQLWIRDPTRDLDGEQIWSFYARQVAGPVLGGIVLSGIRGSEKMAQGEYWRGVEMVMPKFVRDPMKAYRYYEEGALNNKRLAYKEASAFTWVELALQAGGLSDSDLMKQYDTNRALKSYERHVLDRRQQLMTAYWLAWKGRDTQLMVMVKKAVRRFNQRYPSLLLDPSALRRSIRQRLRYGKESVHGLHLNQKLLLTLS